MEILIAVLIGVLLIRWWMIRHEFEEIRRRLSSLESASFRYVETRFPISEPPPAEPREVQVEEVRMAHAPPIVPPPRFEAAAPPRVDHEEWEALVGGSVLNKLGAVVLVVGLILFLGYSMTHMSAAARWGTCAVLSGSMLGMGVALERRSGYRIFGRGLIGAGWASLYATAYAGYALPAARVIGSPTVGTMVLVAVAGGMIAHSLRYRSQTVTCVACCSAFAALAVTSSPWLAAIALFPLAASLLYLAYRFEWQTVGVLGVAASWLTLLTQHDPNAGLGTVTVLCVMYWLIFEAYDWLRLLRQRTGGGAEAILPINAAMFLASMWGAWNRQAPEQMWAMAAIASAMYLVSAILRWCLPRQARSFEAAAGLSAVLAGLAIAGRVPGVWASAALALEAELLYAVGLALGSQFLRGLGAAGFAASALRSFANESTTASLLFHAGLFSVNRWIGGRNVWFVSAAAAAASIVIFREVPVAEMGIAFAGVGVLLWVIADLWRAKDFDYPAYGAMALAFLAAEVAAVGPHCLEQSLVVAALYGCGFWRRKLAWLLAAAGGFLMMVMVWNQVAGGLLTLAWGAAGAALLAAGFAVHLRHLRLQGLALLMICILKLFIWDLGNLETLYRILSFVALGVILLGVSWVYARFRESLRRYF